MWQKNGWFGTAVVGDAGDIDSDGINDIIASAPQLHRFALFGGGIFVLFMNGNDTVRSFSIIEQVAGSGLFGLDGAVLHNLGLDLAVLPPPVHSEFPVDLVIGMNNGDRIIVASLNRNGSVDPGFATLITDDGQNTFASNMFSDSDEFGYSVAAVGDIDGNGWTDLAVGDVLSTSARGEVYLLLLDRSDGEVSVQAHTKVLSQHAFLANTVGTGDRFGSALASLPDVGGDGRLDLAVGIINADGGGAVMLLHLGGAIPSASPTPTPTPSTTSSITPSPTASTTRSPSPSVSPSTTASATSASTATATPTSTSTSSALPTSTASNTATPSPSISASPGLASVGLEGVQPFEIEFSSVTAMLGYLTGMNATTVLSGPGLLPGDRLTDRLIGLPDASEIGKVAVLEAVYGLDGNVSYSARFVLDENAAAIGEALANQVIVSPLRFGASVSFAGDIDGDGHADAVIGAPGAMASEGAVFLVRFGSIPSNGILQVVTVGSRSGGLPIALSVASDFGAAVLGGPEIDLNGDGIPDVVVGAPGPSAGWLGIAMLSRNMTVAQFLRVDPPASMASGVGFGASIGRMGPSSCVASDDATTALRHGDHMAWSSYLPVEGGDPCAIWLVVG